MVFCKHKRWINEKKKLEEEKATVKKINFFRMHTCSKDFCGKLKSANSSLGIKVSLEEKTEIFTNEQRVVSFSSIKMDIITEIESNPKLHKKSQRYKKPTQISMFCE